MYAGRQVQGFKFYFVGITVLARKAQETFFQRTVQALWEVITGQEGKSLCRDYRARGQAPLLSRYYAFAEYYSQGKRASVLAETAVQ